MMLDMEIGKCESHISIEHLGNCIDIAKEQMLKTAVMPKEAFLGDARSDPHSLQAPMISQRNYHYKKGTKE